MAESGLLRQFAVTIGLLALIYPLTSCVYPTSALEPDTDAMHQAVFTQTARERFTCAKRVPPDSIFWYFYLQALEDEKCVKITYPYDQGWKTFHFGFGGGGEYSIEYKPGIMSFHDGLVEGGIMFLNAGPAYKISSAFMDSGWKAEPFFLRHTFDWIKISCFGSYLEYSHGEYWDGETFRPSEVGADSDLMPFFKRLCEPSVRAQFVTRDQAWSAFQSTLAADKVVMERAIPEVKKAEQILEQNRVKAEEKATREAAKEAARIAQAQAARNAREKEEDALSVEGYEWVKGAPVAELRLGLTIVERGAGAEGTRNDSCFDSLGEIGKAFREIDDTLDHGYGKERLRAVEYMLRRNLWFGIRQCRLEVVYSCRSAAAGSKLASYCASFDQLEDATNRELTQRNIGNHL